MDDKKLGVLFIPDNEREIPDNILQGTSNILDEYVVEKMFTFNDPNEIANKLVLSLNQNQCQGVIVLVSFQSSYHCFDAIASVYHQPLVQCKNSFYNRYKSAKVTREYSNSLEIPQYCRELVATKNKTTISIFCMPELFIVNTDNDECLLSLSVLVMPKLSILFSKRTYVQSIFFERSRTLQFGDILHNMPDIESQFTLGENSVTIKSDSIKEVTKTRKALVNMFTDQIKKCAFGANRSSMVLASKDPHIIEAIECIQECIRTYGAENIFLCFNGGKDCTVLLHLWMCVLKQCKSDISPFCLYIENQSPFNEVSEFVKDLEAYYNLKLITHREDIKESLILTMDSYPQMKACLMGTRRTDPYSEHLNNFQMTDSSWPQIMRVSPLLDWKYSQIWEHLLTYKVPYCSLYDRGYTSLGSTTNTTENPALRILSQTNGRVVYLPAYKLFDGSLERNGRIQGTNS